MAENKAWITGPDNLNAWYLEMAENECPYYSVWMGKQLLFSYSGDNIDKGSEKLLFNLNMAVEERNSTVMILKLHPELNAKYVNEKTPYSCSVLFRCVPVDQDAMGVYNVSGMGALEGLYKRVKALEGGEGEVKEGGAMGFINGLLANPQVGPAIAQAGIGAIIGIINKFIPGIFPAQPGQGGSPAQQLPQNAALGAVPEQVKDLDWALDTLEATNPDMTADLVRLAELSIKNPDLFKLLITQLRTL